MKTQTALAVALGVALAASARGNTNAPTASTNLLAIYLVAERIPDEQLRNHTATVTDVRLAPTPILADDDFVTCDLTKDTFVITPAAAIRFGIATFAARVPYVMVAEGKRIYLGVFDTYVSSSGTGLPGTFPDIVLVDCFMGPDNIPEEVLATIRTRDRVVTEHLLALASTKPTTNVVVTIPTLNDKRVAAAAKKLFERSKR
jgi:hypothetical protein